VAGRSKERVVDAVMPGLEEGTVSVPDSPARSKERGPRTPAIREAPSRPGIGRGEGGHGFHRALRDKCNDKTMLPTDRGGTSQGRSAPGLIWESPTVRAAMPESGFHLPAASPQASRTRKRRTPRRRTGAHDPNDICKTFVEWGYLISIAEVCRLSTKTRRKCPDVALKASPSR